MIIEIDHILVAARDPDAAAADLVEALGLARAGGGVHAAIGTRNALLSLAGPYLEVIGLADEDPATRDRAARHPIGAAVLAALDGTAGNAAEGASHLVFVSMALRADDVARTVSGLAAAGHAPGTVSEVVRRRPDGSIVRWPVALPPRLGPALPPFLIEHAPDEPERAARVAGSGPRLLQVVIPVDDPSRAAEGWDVALGLASVPAPSTGVGQAIEIGPHHVLLAPAAGALEPVGPVAGPVVIRLAGGSEGPRSATRGSVRIDVE